MIPSFSEQCEMFAVQRALSQLKQRVHESQGCEVSDPVTIEVDGQKYDVVLRSCPVGLHRLEHSLIEKQGE